MPFVVVYLISLMLLLKAIGPHVDISIVLFVCLDDGNTGAGLCLILELHLALLSVLSGLIHINGADFARRVCFWALPLKADDDRYDSQDYDDAATDCENGNQTPINVWFVTAIGFEERTYLLDICGSRRYWCGIGIGRDNRARWILAEEA